jgi:phosphohistidine phosphatase
MGLHLILARHAKSSWGDPLLEDIDRDLNTRGTNDAILIGQWLAANGYCPDEALVSAACRTQQTWSLIKTTATLDTTKVAIYDGLYLASSDQILHHIRQATGNTVLVIAHNPGIGDFATRFAKVTATHSDFARYPTCATTVFDVKASSWSDVKFGENPILDFCVPRELRP